jgi:hypothetical protein
MHFQRPKGDASKVFAMGTLVAQGRSRHLGEAPLEGAGKGITMTSKRQTVFKPGETAPASGQYQELGPRGGPGREVTVVRGETLPPTTRAGSTYILVDPSKNRSGRP